jgi:hypothetical protein
MSLATHLEAARAFDDDYGDGLSNHLPMALTALHRLGADDDRLQSFAAAYRGRLRPARPPRPWPSGDAWFSRLGEADAWPLYRDLFDQWLQHEDAGEVLRAVLPRLMQGSGGAAFHGLIRVSSAVQAAWRPELADALAAWASRWLALEPRAATTPDTRDPAELLRAWGGPRRPVRGRLILERLQAVAAEPGFDTAVGRLAADAGTLAPLARGAATLYAASGSFTLLHLMTSSHALRELLPFLDGNGDADAAVRAYWRAWAAGWAASGASPSPEPVANLGWDEIVRRALASDDEHVIKGVDSAREHERALGPGPWREAAARAVAVPAALPAA